jgi:hypothetical protein
MMVPRREITTAVLSCRSAFIGVALISGVVNVLYLTGSLFMLEVYDRVVPSRSLPMLVGLGALALGLYAVQGALRANDHEISESEMRKYIAQGSHVMVGPNNTKGAIKTVSIAFDGTLANCVDGFSGFSSDARRYCSSSSPPTGFHVRFPSFQA